MPLPAASPELNPTEQVWQALRDESLANRCFYDYEDIYSLAVKLGIHPQFPKILYPGTSQSIE